MRCLPRAGLLADHGSEDKVATLLSTHSRTLDRRLAASGPALPAHVAQVTGADELEGMRRNRVALPESAGSMLHGEDYLAAFGSSCWSCWRRFL